MLRYAIVEATCTAADATRLATQGIDYIQLRAKHLPTGDLATLARTILAAIASVPNAHTKLLINTRADVALATNAHGVHLTSNPEELTPQQIRTLYSTTPTPYSLLPTPCTSISCHTLANVHLAHTLAADLILFGPIFEKRISGELIQPGVGLQALEAAVRVAQGTPILALGGITKRNTHACLEAGAAGIAAIRLFA
jgi:thiamine-phosphate pyrophosphorylase